MRSYYIRIYSIAAMLMGICLSWINTTYAAEKLLTIESSQKQKQLVGHAKHFLKAELHEKGVREFVLAKAHSSVVTEKTNDIEINLTNGLSVIAHKLRVETLKGNTAVWYGTLPETRTARALAAPGEVPADPLNEVTLVRHGKHITGLVRVKGDDYEIFPTENSEHVVIKIDQKKMPPETRQDMENMPPKPETGTRLSDTNYTKSNHSVIRVLVVTTKQVRDTVPDIEDRITLAFALANTANSNSGVEFTFEKAGIMAADYNENGTFSNMLSQIKDSKDAGLGHPVKLVRDEQRADLVVMWVKNSTSKGLATFLAKKETAFSVVNYESATTSFTFAHEMAHNFGLEHDRIMTAGQPPLVPSYVYGFVQKERPDLWRTIMAHASSCNGCPRINYWSTPERVYKGHAMGTVKYENGALRLNERREEIANFYPSLGASPAAAAVARAAVAKGRTTITLDGTATRNAMGGSLHYEWVQVSGHPAVTINNSTQAIATVTLPPVTQATPVGFELIVTNNAGKADSKQVSFVAQPSGPAPRKNLH